MKPAPLKVIAGLALVVLALMLHAQPARGNSSGIFQKSGKQGSICSTTAGCHFGGTAPLVSLDGPSRLLVGTMATFHFVIQSQSATQKFAGFNVAASGGTLGIIAPGERKILDEISHLAPRQNDANGRAAFDFTWVAPTTPGDYTLFGAGNSVNKDTTIAGDLAAATTLVVHVSAAACACDCNSNGSIAADELLHGVDIALGVRSSAFCTAADLNKDGVVTIAELVAAIGAAQATCAP